MSSGVERLWDRHGVGQPAGHDLLRLCGYLLKGDRSRLSDQGRKLWFCRWHELPDGVRRLLSGEPRAADILRGKRAKSDVLRG